MAETKEKLPANTELSLDETILLREIIDNDYSIELALASTEATIVTGWKGGIEHDPLVIESFNGAAKKKTKQIAASLAEKLRILARGLK